MAGALYDLIKFATATTGNGTLAVGVAVAPFATPAAAGIPDGTTVEYSINDGVNSEKGLGVTGLSGTTLTRGSPVVAYVNGVKQATPISLSGAAIVFLDPSAEGLTAPLTLFVHANLGAI
jgi:hypothetical protein